MNSISSFKSQSPLLYNIYIYIYICIKVTEKIKLQNLGESVVYILNTKKCEIFLSIPANTPSSKRERTQGPLPCLPVAPLQAHFREKSLPQSHNLQRVLESGI